MQTIQADDSWLHADACSTVFSLPFDVATLQWVFPVIIASIVAGFFGLSWLMEKKKLPDAALLTIFIVLFLLFMTIPIYLRTAGIYPWFGLITPPGCELLYP